MPDVSDSTADPALLSRQQKLRLLVLTGLGGSLWLSPFVLEYVEIAFAIPVNESMFQPFGKLVSFLGFVYLLVLGGRLVVEN